MGFKKLAVATLLVVGGVAVATSTPALDYLRRPPSDESSVAVAGHVDSAQRLESAVPPASAGAASNDSRIGMTPYSEDMKPEDMKPTDDAEKVSPSTSADETGKQAPKEPVKLAGQWRVIRALRDGAELPFDRYGSMSVQFDEGTIIIKTKGKQEVGKLSTERVDMIGDTSFAEILISPAEDSQEDKQPIRGFYYHEEGELTFIWGAPGAARPDPTDRKAFASARVLTLEIANNQKGGESL